MYCKWVFFFPSSSILENRHISRPLRSDGLYGKVPPPKTVGGSPAHKQRSVGDYLLFKQIAGLCGRGCRDPWTSLHFRCLRVPARALELSWEISNYLARTAFGSPGGPPAATRDHRWLVGGHAERPPGSRCLGGLRLPGCCAISWNKLVEDLLNVCQALAKYTNYGEYLLL